ncbi:8363_t:CDS:2, partial [Entrophospora sp. SA101]
NYENTTFRKLNEDSLRKVLSNNKENLCVLEIAEYNELINKSSENIQLKANIQFIQNELDQLKENFDELFLISGK